MRIKGTQQLSPTGTRDICPAGRARGSLSFSVRQVSISGVKPAGPSGPSGKGTMARALDVLGESATVGQSPPTHRRQPVRARPTGIWLSRSLLKTAGHTVL
jgi:hypothetical protein